mmetsp:Transcript_5869/g.16648  ORF Transcript_5869/g.16648 Transcript_5869/m.16648 type:complete len:347 (-) Transcript_5869:339-1379(-)
MSTDDRCPLCLLDLPILHIIALECDVVTSLRLRAASTEWHGIVTVSTLRRRLERLIDSEGLRGALSCVGDPAEMPNGLTHFGYVSRALYVVMDGRGTLGRWARAIHLAAAVADRLPLTLCPRAIQQHFSSRRAYHKTPRAISQYAAFGGRLVGMELTAGADDGDFLLGSQRVRVVPHGDIDVDHPYRQQYDSDDPVVSTAEGQLFPSFSACVVWLVATCAHQATRSLAASTVSHPGPVMDLYRTLATSPIQDDIAHVDCASPDGSKHQRVIVLSGARRDNAFAAYVRVSAASASGYVVLGTTEADVEGAEGWLRSAPATGELLRRSARGIGVDVDALRLVDLSGSM